MPTRTRLLRWQIVLFTAGVAVAAAALIVRPVLRAQMRNRPGRAMQQAQAALEAGDARHAVEFAQLAFEQARRYDRATGPALLALGLAREQQAEAAAPAEQSVYYAAAVQNLNEAARVGVPAEDRSRLNLHLGRCLYTVGQIAESVAVLSQGLRSRSDWTAESLQLLTRAYLHPDQLDLDRALETNTELLATPGLTEDQAARAWEVRAEILHRLGKLDCPPGLVSPTSDADVRCLSVLLRAADCLNNKRFDEAIALYRGLASRKGLPPEIERQAWYLLGRAAQDADDRDAALSTFRTVEWRYPNTEEARAAAAHAGALLLESGEISVGVAALRRAVQQKPPDGDQITPLLDDAELGSLIISAVNQLREQRQFSAAAELLDETNRMLVPPPTADLIAAQLHEAWARATLHEAESLGSLEGSRARYRARELFRAAGAFYMRVADARMSDQAANAVLWQAAQAFQQGENHLGAFAAAERLLACSDPSDAVRPQAMALACAALQGCAKLQLIHEFAETCIREYPDHPAAAVARYHWAGAQIAEGAFQRAEATLRANLATPVAEASGEIAQRSRLLLAKLCRDQGRDDDAIVQLYELLAGPADGDTSVEGRLLLADCLRARARRPAGRLETAGSEQAKSHYRRQKQHDLERALEQLGQVQRELFDREQDDQASTAQLDAIRQARWAIADCLYELDRVEDAILVYRSLAEIYTEPSDWLETQIQIANCYARMNRLEDARSVLRAARDRLHQMPPDAVEQARRGLSPNRWQEWLSRTNHL